VKRGPPSQHLFNQLFDSIKSGRISEPGRQATVMLDLLIDLNALLTHFQLPHAASIWQPYLAVSYKTMKPLFCSFSNWPLPNSD
jgi:hypothetical protein